MTDFETRTPDWLSIHEALHRILSDASPLEMEGVEVREAWGRALAEGVLARAALPPWDNSAMDGYAVRASDVRGASRGRPVVLAVVGQTSAGEPAGPSLGAGEAVRIMTGAPIPPGADAVVRVENTDAEGAPGQVRIFSDEELGGNIRPGGQDMRKGQEVLGPGTSLGSGQLGLLASAGARTVRVCRRPRVAILSNGDELAPPSQFHRVVAGEAIPETNGITLAAAVAASGGIPIPLGIAADNPESILHRVSQALEKSADVLLISGGASMGERDLIKRSLDGMGFRLAFWRVKIRPGTPFSYGTLPRSEGGDGLRVFGLPGNPASSFVTFQLFARPFLLALAGHRRIHRPVVHALAGESLESPSHLTHFFRVTLKEDGGPLHAYLAGPQGSGLVRAQGLAQGLAVVPEGVARVEPGESLRVVLLDEMGLGGDRPGY